MSHDETGPLSRSRLSKGVESPDGDGQRQYEPVPPEIGSVWIETRSGSFTTSNDFSDWSDDFTTSDDEDEESEEDTEFFIKSKRTEKRRVSISRFSKKKKRNYRPSSTEE